MSIITSSNKTLSKDGTFKIDCAKECPCGIPTIPVPDKWLEVMVVGGFKVWHIVFIIIALIITIIVVYCCFHRCRIPRTKQEIEADLMRATLTNKFRDYLQEMTNEQITFIEALKKVHDIAEKLEEDDAMLARELGNRKRMGWLKLKGKGGQEKDPIPTNLIEASAEEIAKQQQLQQQQQQQQDPTAAIQSKDTDRQDQTVNKLVINGRQSTLEKVKPVNKQDMTKTNDRIKSNTETLAETKPLNRSVDKPVNELAKNNPNSTKLSKDDQTPLLDVPDERGGNKGAKIVDDSKHSANLLNANGRTKPVRRRRQKPPNLTRTKATARNISNREFEESPNVLEDGVNTSHNQNHGHSHRQNHGSNHNSQTHTHRSRTGHHGKVKLNNSLDHGKQEEPKD